MKRQRTPRKVKKAKQLARKRWMNEILSYTVEVAFNPLIDSSKILLSKYIGGIDAYDIDSISKSYSNINKQKYQEYLLPEYKTAIKLLQNEFMKKGE